MREGAENVIGRTKLLGYRIFRHSLIQVTGNLKNALRISAVLWAAPMIPFLLFNAEATKHIQSGTGDLVEGTGIGIPTVIIIALIFFGFLSVIALPWIAVAWHRYVLKNELNLSVLYIPKTSVGAIAGYIWKGIVLSSLLMVMLIPLMFVLLFVSASVVASGEGLVLTVLLNLFGVLSTYVFLRISLILPARALDDFMGIGESWRYTAKVGPSLWITALLLVLINMGLGVVTEIFLPGSLTAGAISTVVTFIINWITMMVGVSILTTLYGYCVEDRELI